MKTLFISALAALALCSCSNPAKYTIEGNFEGLTGTVYLFDDQQNVLDSTSVDNGAFRFKGIAEAPALRYIADSQGEAPTFTALLILEPGTITIAPDSNSPMNTSASGTPANDANKNFSAIRAKLIKEFRDQNTPEERRTAIEKEFDDLTRQTLDANRDNFFGILLLDQQLVYELSGQEILDEIAKFSAPLQQTPLATKLREGAELKLKTEVGQPYIDIAQKNPAGESVTLRSVIENPANKYTLLDFWASWCSPCMEEVPFLKKTYDEFGGKGFEIYGVSFDKDREKWLGAIDAHKMSWIHVSEVMGFDNQAARDYGVRSIPSNFLIDAQGMIVACNLRGEELYTKVAELLAAPAAAPQQ